MKQTTNTNKKTKNYKHAIILIALLIFAIVVLFTNSKNNITGMATFAGNMPLFRVTDMIINVDCNNGVCSAEIDRGYLTQYTSGGGKTYREIYDWQTNPKIQIEIYSEYDADSGAAGIEVYNKILNYPDLLIDGKPVKEIYKLNELTLFAGLAGMPEASFNVFVDIAYDDFYLCSDTNCETPANCEVNSVNGLGKTGITKCTFSDNNVPKYLVKIGCIDTDPYNYPERKGITTGKYGITLNDICASINTIKQASCNSQGIAEYAADETCSAGESCCNGACQKPGLVAKWNFEDNLLDSAICGPDVDPFGSSDDGVSAGSISYYSGDDSIDGKALITTNGYMEVGQSLPFPAIRNALTVSAWVRFNGESNQNYYLIIDRQDFERKAGWNLHVDKANSRINFRVLDGTTFYDAGFDASKYIKFGQWYHIMGVYDGGNTNKVSIYLNTKKMAEVNGPSEISQAYPSQFQKVIVGQGVNGLIDDARVYNYAVISADASSAAMCEDYITENACITSNALGVPRYATPCKDRKATWPLSDKNACESDGYCTYYSDAPSPKCREKTYCTWYKPSTPEARGGCCGMKVDSVTGELKPMKWDGIKCKETETTDLCLNILEKPPFTKKPASEKFKKNEQGKYTHYCGDIGSIAYGFWEQVQGEMPTAAPIF